MGISFAACLVGFCGTGATSVSFGTFSLLLQLHHLCQRNHIVVFRSTPWQMSSLVNAHVNVMDYSTEFGKATLPQHLRRHNNNNQRRGQHVFREKALRKLTTGDGGGSALPPSIGNGSSNSTKAKELQKKIKQPPLYGAPLSVKLGFYLESLGDFRETQMV